MPSISQRLDQLTEDWNEAEISRPSLQRWMDQLPNEDHAIALRLMECMEFHGYFRLVRKCRQIHRNLCDDLAQRGFDTETYSDIDFTRAFTCKSGDVIAYIYRKANLIAVTSFHNVEALLADPRRNLEQKRALVILDDYIGTGSHFLFQFAAREPAHCKPLNSYACLHFLAIAIHDDGKLKHQLLAKGAVEEVMTIEEQELTCIDFSKDRNQLISALSSVNLQNSALLGAQRDFSLLDHPQLSNIERSSLVQFLERHDHHTEVGTTEFLLGHHKFFYGGPNALPRLLLPLFKRVEDFTIYPRDVQAGLPEAIMSYDIDGPIN
jgi:hypothetical protein